MFTTINSPEEFAKLKSQKAMLAYFSTASCSTCHALRPKVEQRIMEAFPGIELAYIQSDKQPEIAARNRVFTAPTVVVFFEGREYIRKSRSFSVDELQVEIERYYNMLFTT